MYAGGGPFDIIRTRDLQIMSNALLMEAGALTRLSFRVILNPGLYPGTIKILNYP